VVVTKKIAYQASPPVGDGPIAIPRSPRHPLINQNHDDFVLGAQLDRRRRSAICLPRPVAHRDTRTLARRPGRKRPVQTAGQIARGLRIPMKQYLDAKRRHHLTISGQPHD
jgi:hypothetical protein